MKCSNSAFNAQGCRLAIVSCTGKSSENICSSSGGAQEKGKTGWNWVYYQKLMVFWVSLRLPWMLMYFFAGFFLGISPRVWRVLVLCVSYYTDNSNRPHKVKRSRNFISFYVWRVSGSCRSLAASYHSLAFLVLCTNAVCTCVMSYRIISFVSTFTHFPSPHTPHPPPKKKKTIKILKFFKT
jgi:hypothetical protein